MNSWTEHQNNNSNLSVEQINRKIIRDICEMGYPKSLVQFCISEMRLNIRLDQLSMDLLLEFVKAQAENEKEMKDTDTTGIIDYVETWKDGYCSKCADVKANMVCLFLRLVLSL